ncbi:unnamed protein product [Parnassius apollo]|uniref:(apollo) hypothetical protein n=1 Tax=Parnassius apollo TaxID=110799 RepID=A0A8S3WMA3_PARAO|nr:unnamed protein product [Parnassius apollo]
MKGCDHVVCEAWDTFPMAATSGSPPPGVVELREDVPLKSGGGDTQRCAGPRLIATAFAVLTVAITLALLTQIYYGDYEVVPHGSVSTSVGACSRGGAALLRARGSALDAAAAAALCLALAAPYDTALDASGALLYWEYRRAHNEPPTLAEWGAVGDDWQMAGDSMPEAGGSLQEAGGSGNGTVPRLVAALAGLHVRYGMLPWAQVLQPAIDYAESSEATTASGAIETGVSVSERVKLLREWQRHTSAELCAAWRCASALRVRAAAPVSAGAWRAYVAGAAWGGAGGAAQPLRQALLANSTGYCDHTLSPLN